MKRRDYYYPSRTVEQYLTDHPGSRSHDIADATGLLRTQVRAILTRLHSCNAVRLERPGYEPGLYYMTPLTDARNKANMNRIKASISLESPGGTSALVTNVTEAEYQTLLRIAIEMNNANPTHAAPYMNVERVE